MSEKKNIDRLFQEKFKDFDVAPSEKLWQNIEAELQKDKKKRRIIPIWWYRAGGVAAILVIGLMLSWPVINGDKDNTIDTTVNPVVQDDTQQNTNNAGQNDNNIVSGVENAVTQEGNSQTENAASQDERAVNKTAAKTGTIPFNESDAVVIENDNSKIITKTKSGKAVVITPIEPKMLTEQERIARNKAKNNSKDAPSQQKTNAITTEDDKLGVLQQENNEGVAVNDNFANSGSTASEEGNNTENNSRQLNDTEKEGKLNQMINGSQTEVAETEDITDSTTVEKENELEKLLKEKEEAEKDKAIAEVAKNYKWNVKPQVAPLFYNSMSQGSPIDAQFASNSKNYDADLSYGVGLDYAINDRFSIRSGINTVNLSYATNDVTYYASLDGQTNNIVSAGRSANIVIETQNGNGDIAGLTPTTGTAPVLFASNTFANQNFEGQMVQKMGYIEVPLEMSYKLLNKKFGVELIGGFSTLFLNNNNISVVSNQGYSTDVGEAGNLNNVNFSTNLGVGFKYSFWKSFEANFEPTFKYQVNTFNGSSGNFRPYFIGLYSGVSFKF